MCRSLPGGARRSSSSGLINSGVTHPPAAVHNGGDARLAGVESRLRSVERSVPPAASRSPNPGVSTGDRRDEPGHTDRSFRCGASATVPPVLTARRRTGRAEDRLGRVAGDDTPRSAWAQAAASTPRLPERYAHGAASSPLATACTSAESACRTARLWLALPARRAHPCIAHKETTDR
jgi:hypothetical protein